MTTTRERLLLAASLLTMTAGRVLRISLPIEGSNSTHQTSPRFIAHISGQRIAPFGSFRLAGLIFSHGLVAVIQCGFDDMGPNQVFDELAHAPPAHYAIETVIHILVERDCHPLVHNPLLYAHKI